MERYEKIRQECIEDIRLEQVNKLMTLLKNNELRQTLEFDKWQTEFTSFGDRIQEITERVISTHSSVYDNLEYQMKTHFAKLEQFHKNSCVVPGPKKYNMYSKSVQISPVPKGGPGDKLKFKRVNHAM